MNPEMFVGISAGGAYWAGIFTVAFIWWMKAIGSNYRSWTLTNIFVRGTDFVMTVTDRMYIVGPIRRRTILIRNADALAFTATWANGRPLNPGDRNMAKRFLDDYFKNEKAEESALELHALLDRATDTAEELQAVLDGANKEKQHEIHEVHPVHTGGLGDWDTDLDDLPEPSPDIHRQKS